MTVVTLPLTRHLASQIACSTRYPREKCTEAFWPPADHLADPLIVFPLLSAVLLSCLLLRAQVVGDVVCDEVTVVNEGKVFGDISSARVTVGPQVQHV